METPARRTLARPGFFVRRPRLDRRRRPWYTSVQRNVLAIYEQFRPLLGEEAAKNFGQTLDGLLEEAKSSVRKEDFRLLRESIDANVSRLESAITKLAEAQGRTEQRVDELAHDVEQLTHVLRRVAIRTDEHSGMILELRIRDRLASYVGLWLRRARLTDVTALIDPIEPAVSPKELEDLTRADLIAEGALDGQPTYVVGEVSWTADFEDIARAVRRASVLPKAGSWPDAGVARKISSPPRLRRNGI